ncbi:hypothetical protein FHU10_1176 [Serratia fonticola]|jgi:hypothetical protein|uniref:Agglutination protein n=1 Tax=Serratia fonticola TaxID=47917 RepID=A0A542BJL9_SERFO|nr:2OG-Fe dioxygenase family protein [Serratia fonticola]TQI78781.1 hypothetical protein FHU09_1275 [Serratia fonticola]TQI99197.1 hypothetical protein FHU11_4777 [Serratia fonticola]TVZ68722.1 hypothetical protein FHU10_1176 [Serratia fonticola]
MLNKHENILHITHLDHKAVAQLIPSFSSLPHTQHADGKYRLRRYSVMRFLDGKVVETSKHDFVQSEDINHFQGNIVRRFEPLLPMTLQSEGMREMCRLFVEINDLPNNQEIEIHQMRITTTYDETPVSPEGIHRDGFDHIAIIGIDRHNIVGGETMLYNGNREAPFFRKILEDGEIIMIADSKLWHNACPIRAIVKEEEGHMDVFVLTARAA